MLTNIYSGETLFHVCVSEWHKTFLDGTEDKNDDLVDPKPQKPMKTSENIEICINIEQNKKLVDYEKYYHW
jgi:hypothetical protein